MSNLELSVACESTGLVLSVNGLGGASNNRICYLISESELDCGIQKISLGQNITSCFFNVINNASYTLINEVDEDLKDNSGNAIETDNNVSIEQRTFTINMKTPVMYNDTINFIECITARINYDIFQECGINDISIYGLAVYTKPSTSMKYVEPYDNMQVSEALNNNRIEFDELHRITEFKLSFFVKYTSDGINYTTCPSCLVTASTMDVPSAVTNLTCALYDSTSYSYTYDPTIHTSGVEVTWGIPTNVCDEDNVLYTLKRTDVDNSNETVLFENQDLSSLSHIDLDGSLNDLIPGHDYKYSVTCIFSDSSGNHPGIAEDETITYRDAPKVLTLLDVNNVTDFCGTYYIDQNDGDASVVLQVPDLFRSGGYTLNKIYCSTNSDLSSPTELTNYTEYECVMSVSNSVSSTFTGSRYYFYDILDNNGTHLSPVLTLDFVSYSGLETPVISSVDIPHVASSLNTCNGTVSWGALSSSGLGGAVSYEVTAQTSCESDIIGTTSSSSYTFTSLIPNKQYTFTVQATEELTDADCSGSIQVPSDTSETVTVFAHRASSAVSVSVDYTITGFSAPSSSEVPIAPYNETYVSGVFDKATFTFTSPSTLGNYSIYSLKDSTTSPSNTTTTLLAEPVSGNTTELPSTYEYTLGTGNKVHTFIVSSTTPAYDFVANGTSGGSTTSEYDYVPGVDSSSVSVTKFVEPGIVSDLSADFLKSVLSGRLEITGTLPADTTGVEIFVDGVFVGRSTSSLFTIDKSYTLSGLTAGQVFKYESRAYKEVTMNGIPYYYIGEMSDEKYYVYHETPSCSITATQDGSSNNVSLNCSYILAGYQLDSINITRSGSNTTIDDSVYEESSGLETPFTAPHVLPYYDLFTFTLTVTLTDQNTNTQFTVYDSDNYLYAIRPTVVPTISENLRQLTLTITPNGSPLNKYIAFVTPGNKLVMLTSPELSQTGDINDSTRTLDYVLTLSYAFDIENVLSVVSNGEGFGIGEI